MSITEKLEKIYLKYKKGIIIAGVVLALGGTYYQGRNDKNVEINQRLQDLDMQIHTYMGRTSINPWREKGIWQLDENLSTIIRVMRENKEDKRKTQWDNYLNDIYSQNNK